MVDRRLLLAAIGIVTFIGAAWGAILVRESFSPIERWERLPEQQREQVRERFEEYKRMSDEEQSELADRSRNLQRMKRRIAQRMSTLEREKLLAMDAKQRDEILSELLEDALKARGARLRAKLPDDIRDQLEGASPAERGRFFADFKEKTRKRMSLSAIDTLGRRLGYTREELRTMKLLPDDERMERLLELRKQLQQQSVKANGLPVGLSRARWEEILALEPEEFFEEVIRIRESGAWHDRRNAKGASREELEERRRRAAWDILGELRPRPSERLELAELSRQDRHAKVARSRRNRIQAILEQHEVFPPKRLEEFRTLSANEFHARVRRLVRESGAMKEARAQR